MVNVKDVGQMEGKKTNDEEKCDVKERHSLKSSKEISSTTQNLQERLKTLESRIEVVRLDFKKQVEGLRARMENINTNVKTVQGEMRISWKPYGTADENETTRAS